MSDEQSPKKLDAVLVGLGRSGAELHIPILHKLQTMNPLTPFGRVAGLVDVDEKKVARAVHRLTDDHNYRPEDLVSSQSIETLNVANREDVIVHVCTPAHDHLQSVTAAANAGFRRFIVEKPCAGTATEVNQMLRSAERLNLQIGVVNPYLYSASVERCHNAIRARSPPRYIEFELSKPRKAPTIAQRSSVDSVFDVELPHQIATALHLVSPRHYSVLRADVRDMHYRQGSSPCIVINNMGVGFITLQLDSTVVLLVSYLDAYTRTRSLHVRFDTNEEVVAYMPVSEEDHTAELVTFGPPDSTGHSPQVDKDKYVDDLFTTCLDSLYTRLSDGTCGWADLEFNQRVVEIMDSAKELARVRKR